jgi:hypothetical protein
MIDMTNLILESNAFKNGEQIPKNMAITMIT